ncbi:YqjF family protein [Agromyces sp. NPDC058110]|uniref:YqjF family protein n=1 Tax=Agromyces sp. NPDC058110 TaxID=3346345 RepID=UPI0036D8203F
MIEPISSAPPHRIDRVIASQRWSDVLFVHWRLAPERVVPLLPRGTEPDVYDGGTWVGLIAFRLEDARLGPVGPVPLISDFVEVNVRLYAVDEHGRRGVVFRSLEAASSAAVVAARAGFALPYQWAATSGGIVDDVVSYRSRRHGSGSRSSMSAQVDRTRVVDDPQSVFLTARWSMFTSRVGRTRWHPNVHEPWVLHPATLLTLDDELVTAAGLDGVADAVPESVLFSDGVSARFGQGVGE